MEQRRPARSYNTRRPARSYNPRRPARKYTTRRPARKYFTIGIGLKACSGIEAAEKGEQTLARDVKIGLEGEVFITSAVADMHANRGKRKDVRNLFEKMPQCVEVPWKSHRDVGFVCLKKGEVKRMNGHPLALTRACSISAASEQGQLTDAETLIKEMPFSLDIVVWPTLPGACTILGNPEFGAPMAQHIFELDPQADISFGMLSSNYVGFSILDEVAEVRKLINDRRVRRAAGYSWNEVNGKSHLFMVGGPLDAANG
ncbi:pentatricopeptide repeat-containing protein At4g02750 isoform X2 [Cryptomeria japonica]|uniref:pentatricopeptide repeat-containing protein At4g02750 isoform X2 n=1 Tax=Cryptomeria japonica TaxID=3369 RepID=UPI0027DA9EE3|nr:pentatricopeptide repeat-containing protein At4g02750 isoform X2 [Cryptomeria japonica]